MMNILSFPFQFPFFLNYLQDVKIKYKIPGTRVEVKKIPGTRVEFNKISIRLKKTRRSCKSIMIILNIILPKVYYTCDSTLKSNKRYLLQI